MIQGLTITEFSSNGVRESIKTIWDNILKLAAPKPILDRAADD
jgi:hypothetical protein